MQQPARNIYQLLENTVDDLGNALVVGALAAGGGIIWLGNEAIQALRPYFGQDANEVFWLSTTTAVVMIAGTTYIVKKRRGGTEVENDDPDNSRPPFIQRVQSFVSQIQGHTNAAAEAEPTPPAKVDPKSEIAMNRLEEALHVAIFTKTGGGKTVLATAIMQRIVASGGKYLVLDGKPGLGWDEKWPNATRKIKDPAMFDVALKVAEYDMQKRIRAGKKRFMPYVIVLDEASVITGTSKDAEQSVANILKLGREYNMRVWMMSQAGTVAEIGFDGRTELLKGVVGVELDVINGERVLHFGKLVSGSLVTYKPTFPVPDLPAPWADVSGMPTYDDSGEFNLYGRAVQAPLPTVNGVVQNGLHSPLHRQNEATLPEVGAHTQDAPVQVVQADSDKTRKTARWMIEAMTDESAYPIGKRFLTVGESSAIFYLNQMEWSQNDIIDFVLGTKNTQRQAAVAGVLEKV